MFSDVGLVSLVIVVGLVGVVGPVGLVSMLGPLGLMGNGHGGTCGQMDWLVWWVLWVRWVCGSSASCVFRFRSDALIIDIVTIITDNLMKKVIYKKFIHYPHWGKCVNIDNDSIQMKKCVYLADS